LNKKKAAKYAAFRVLVGLTTRLSDYEGRVS